MLHLPSHAHAQISVTLLLADRMVFHPLCHPFSSVFCFHPCLTMFNNSVWAPLPSDVQAHDCHSDHKLVVIGRREPVTTISRTNYRSSSTLVNRAHGRLTRCQSHQIIQENL